MLTELDDKCLGGWIGLAVGDALGAPIQFKPRDTYSHVKGYTSGGTFNLEPGYWTDDTSMALCLAETLIERGEYDQRDYGERLIRWVEEGYNSSLPKCFDIGQATLRAISNIKRTGPESSGINEENACGNGSIMRLAPIPIFYRNAPDLAKKFSILQGVITHSHTLPQQCCQILCSIILDAFNASSKEDIFINFSTDHSSYDDRLDSIFMCEFKDKSRDEIKSDTFVISTLEASLWAVWNTDNFQDALLLAVNLGHDADTVGAVTGQIAGALYGYSTIPEEWVQGLAEHERVINLGKTLIDTSIRTQHERL
jgi:ADP-ribosyl-[dinitrogen reductase] hydrolase